MLIKNSADTYGLVAIIFHWLIAIIIIGMLALGLYMVGLPISPQKLKFYRWHKEFGILILMLASARIAWRMSNISPLLPAYLSTWQRIAARLVHYAFYLFMIAMPLTGWMISSSAGISVSFFGLFILPEIISPNESTRILVGEIHEWLAYGLITCIILHVAAVLEHYIIHKNNILKKMWP